MASTSTMASAFIVTLPPLSIPSISRFAPAVKMHAPAQTSVRRAPATGASGNAVVVAVPVQAITSLAVAPHMSAVVGRLDTVAIVSLIGPVIVPPVVDRTEDHTGSPAALRTARLPEGSNPRYMLARRAATGSSIVGDTSAGLAVMVRARVSAS